MKKIIISTFASLVLFTSNAQIVITAANMPVSGDTIRISNAALSSVGDYTTTGANHTWHFDTLRPLSQAIRSFKTITQTPYAIYSFTWGPTAVGEKIADTLQLPNLGLPLPIAITNVYNFYSKKPLFTPTKFVTEGTGVSITFSGTTVPLANTYSDEDELYNFSLNYTDRDSTTFRFSTVTTTLIPVQYIKQGYRITQADGWGTIATPQGTVSCLRVVTTQYSIDTLVVSNLPFIGTQRIGFPNYQRSYQWLSTTLHIPYFEVSGNVVGGNFTPNQARYRQNIVSFVGLSETKNNEFKLTAFPNPATNMLTVMLPQLNTNATAQLLDMHGRVVLMQTLQKNTELFNNHQLSISALAKGLYILNVTTADVKQTLKISIQ